MDGAGPREARVKSTRQVNRREMLRLMASLPFSYATKELHAERVPRVPINLNSVASDGAPDAPAWLRDSVFYQVYPQSFFDSDADGTGDLPGLISKLDYVQSLGCTALWLNPVFESPFGDAGYDVTDFLHVASRYGSNEDIRVLAGEAHRRGLKVCLDLVAGHTSVQHPMFRQSMLKERNPYSDWYIWMPAEDAGSNCFAGPGSPNVRTRGEMYQANFFSFQPALNYGYFHPDPAKPWQRPMSDPVCRAVQENLRRVMTFWLELGVDGFRVDMASSLIRNDPDGEGIRELWRENRKWLEAHYPEAVLISEWGNPKQSLAAGFHIDFLLHFGQPAYIELVGPRSAPDGMGRKPDAFFERSGKGDIAKFLKSYLEQYEATKDVGYISLPTGNHDFPRPTRGRSEREVRVFFAMLFTMPGVPFLYYGDEIGMRFLEDAPEKEGANRAGLRAGSRTPMQWSNGMNSGFSGAPSADLYLPIGPDAAQLNVAVEERDSGSMLHFTRQLIRLRHEREALANRSGFRVVYVESGQVPFVYERTHGTQRVLVAINPTLASPSLRLPGAGSATTLMAEGATLQAETLAMEPVSFGIFSLAE